VLVDIGSTTTDLTAMRDGQVAACGVSDAQRLSTGELVYLGVVRTPLCVLARHVPFDGTEVNVMNEFFATTADVYRLTAELDPAHDQQPCADGGAKDADATRQRLARMIGRDASDGSHTQWLALARFWREAQIQQIAGQLERVMQAQGVAPDAPLVGAGCGDFLTAELARRTGRPLRRFAGDTVPLADGAPESLQGWIQVCAPAVAVALLADRDRD
jgi:probable H4MPT-linked C1 transfer pathway protein